MLKKKSNSICYHAVRESVAMGEYLTGHIGTNKKKYCMGRSGDTWYPNFYMIFMMTNEMR